MSPLVRRRVVYTLPTQGGDSHDRSDGDVSRRVPVVVTVISHGSDGVQTSQPTPGVAGRVEGLQVWLARAARLHGVVGDAAMLRPPLAAYLPARCCATRFELLSSSATCCRRRASSAWLRSGLGLVRGRLGVGVRVRVRVRARFGLGSG